MSIAKKEDLKDGKILNELIKRFLNEPKGENLYSIYLCLIDSDLQVPMNITMSEEDKEAFKNSKAGDTVTIKQDLRLKPDLLKNPKNNKLYLPIFSTIKDATEECSKNFSWINMDIDTCINFVDNNKDCSGLILNAFTTPIIIEDDLYKLLKEKLNDVRKNESNK